MADKAAARLQEERKAWRKNHPVGFDAKPSKKADGSSDIMIWDCSIPGKKDTLWEGGIYRVRILFPPTYPIEPPMVTFTPPLFHPNIFTGGQVCLSLLKQQKDWAPSITIGDILLGLQDLLATPNTKDPANWDAAQLLDQKPAQYSQRVREIAARYRPAVIDVDDVAI